MNIRPKLALLGAAWLLTVAGTASAQMFGDRTVGVPLLDQMQQASPGTTGDSQGGAAMGVVPTNARFLRQNRSSDSFVGRGAQGTSHFVGANESGGSVQAAVSDLSSQRAMASANRQLQAALATPPSRLSIYPPRLEVSFAYSAPLAERMSSQLAGRLRGCSEFHATGPVEVVMAGRLAIVRGVVFSERDRALARQLLLFEPGVSAVQNELKIQPPPLRLNRPSGTSPPAQTLRP